MTEADSIKLAETKDLHRADLRGGRPTRIRGYHRAVKRGEEWAVSISKLSGLSFLIAFTYRLVDMELITRSNSFMSLLQKSSDWGNGGYFTFPKKITDSIRTRGYIRASKKNE